MAINAGADPPPVYVWYIYIHTYIPYEEKIIRKRECTQRACWTVVSLPCDIQKLHGNKHCIQWLQHLCVMMMIYTRRGGEEEMIMHASPEKDMWWIAYIHTCKTFQDSFGAFQCRFNICRKPLYMCVHHHHHHPSSSSYPRPTQNHPHHLSESLTCLSLSKTTSISTYKAAPTPSLSLFSANLVKNAKALSALGERPWLHTRLRS